MSNFKFQNYTFSVALTDTKQQIQMISATNTDNFQVFEAFNIQLKQISSDTIICALKKDNQNQVKLELKEEFIIDEGFLNLTLSVSYDYIPKITEIIPLQMKKKSSTNQGDGDLEVLKRQLIQQTMELDELKKVLNESELKSKYYASKTGSNLYQQNSQEVISVKVEKGGLFLVEAFLHSHNQSGLYYLSVGIQTGKQKKAEYQQLHDESGYWGYGSPKMFRFIVDVDKEGDSIEIVTNAQNNQWTLYHGTMIATRIQDFSQ